LQEKLKSCGIILYGDGIILARQWVMATVGLLQNLVNDVNKE